MGAPTLPSLVARAMPRCSRLLPWLSLMAVLAGAGPVLAQSVVIPRLPRVHVPSADQQTRAERAYDEARRRYQKGDLPGALSNADEAWEAVPNASTALIRATILAKMKRHDDAFAALLVGLDLDPTDRERDLIENALANNGPLCSPPLGWVRVEVTPAGARVEVAGKTFDAPRTIGLPAGSHALRISATGHERIDDSLDLRAGRSTRAKYRLTAAAAPAREPAAAVALAPVAPRPVPAETAEAPDLAREPVVRASVRPAWRKALPWTVLGTGVAAIAVGAGLHAWALDAVHDTEKYGQPIAGMTDAERKVAFDRANDHMKTRGNAAIAMYCVGGAAVAGGVAWLVVDAVKGKKGGTAVVPAIDGETVGVAVAGRF